MAIANRFAKEEECLRFERFLSWLALRGRRASTARSYRSDWQDLTIWYRRHNGEPFDGKTMTGELIAEWKSASSRKGRSPSTVLRRMAFARSYVSWMASEGIVADGIEGSVRSQARLTRTDRGPRLLPPTEVNRLLEHVNIRACHRDQAMIYILLDSGLRISEIVTLDVGDVNFETGQLYIKKGRPRTVDIPTRAVRKLAWSLGERGLLELPEDGEIVLPASGGWPPSDLVTPPDISRIPALRAVPTSPMPFGCDGPPSDWPLFVGERGRLSVNGVQRVVRKHATFARVDATPQLLRHTFAFGHWVKHRDLVSLAEALGLESVESVRMYSQLTAPGDCGVGDVDDALALLTPMVR